MKRRFTPIPMLPLFPGKVTNDDEQSLMSRRPGLGEAYLTRNYCH